MKQDVSEITAVNMFKPAKYLLLITHFLTSTKLLEIFRALLPDQKKYMKSGYILLENIP